MRAIMARAPVIPVLTIERTADAVPLARALCAGGLTVLEVTLRTEAALEAITAMRREVPAAIVGAGTLTTPEDFGRVAAAGAQFAVTPGLTEELAVAGRHAGFPLLPGVATASELLQARAAGYTALKFFPAEPAGGTAMLAAFAPVFTDMVFCPTGGITRESAPRYLQLKNVACVGGSWVTPAAALKAGDWAQIEALARDAASLAARG
ncbi:MAG: bifunctional 4-hydroxy-2-oxoglutarate aldolase/2-dehydro-3-deoxy-phosphogluconate aldolase [Gammaproteobacteria bacterium]|nr:bifunctional 4-hydroxy-2-oxoglutarate aldolase/2-dehydro-3-deoxy-phosphogluconate aldolase [Gammaproteobacteria bacterium]